MIFYTYRVKTAAQAIRSAPLVFSSNARVGRTLLSDAFDSDPPHRTKERPRRSPGCAFLVMRKNVNNSKHQQPILVGPPTPNQLISLQASAEPTKKRRGEAAEAAFLARATYLGFTVCIPWGDSNRYDSVVEFNHGLLRVQVKSATLCAETRYRVKTTGASGQVYTSKEIDFFVGYVVPENIWYVIPVQAIGQRKGIRFYPHTRRQSRAIFEKYREAWCLLDSCLAVRLRKGYPERCRSKHLDHRCAVCPQRG
jgi:hypothetical protein